MPSAKNAEDLSDAPTSKQSTPKAPAAKKASAAKSPAAESSTETRSAPAKAAGGKAAPAKAAAGKAAAKAAPSKAAPSKAAATKAAPAKAGTSKSGATTPAGAASKAPPDAPSKGTPDEEVPSKAAASKADAPAKVAPAQAAPVKGTLGGGQAFLDAQRGLLLEERDAHTKQAAGLRAEAEQLAEERDPGDVQFDEESGQGDTMNVERERDLALSAQALQQVQEIDVALAKIDKGTYGLCERCGQPIPEERLQALPWAALDVGCKSMGFARS